MLDNTGNMANVMMAQNGNMKQAPRRQSGIPTSITTRPQNMSNGYTMDTTRRVSVLPPIAMAVSPTEAESQSPHTPTFDRLNTPGKIRAFFDEVKRSRSAGDKTPVHEKYQSLVGADKKRDSIFTDSIVESSGTNFTLGVAGNTGTRTRRPTVSTSGNSSASSTPGKSRRPSGAARPQSEFMDYQMPVIPSVEVARGSMTYPGRRTSQQPAKAQLVIPPTVDDPVEEMEASSTWTETPTVFATKPIVRRKLKTQFDENPSFSEEEEDSFQMEQQSPPAQKSTTIKPAKPTKKIEEEETKVEEEEEPVKKRSPTPEGMTRCEFCERTFAEDRLEKHQTVCQHNPAKKQRKVFDGKTIRTKGTDFENAKKASSSMAGAKVPKKANWREEHEKLQAALKAAKS